jgi:cell division protein FtsQ
MEIGAQSSRLHHVSILTLLVICAFLLVARISYLYLASVERFPINIIKISSCYSHISKKQLENILLKYRNFSFFSFPLNKLKTELLALNWSKNVQVEKIWPDTLKIMLIEKIPVAIWNKAMLTEEGDVVNEGNQLIDPSLPTLIGPVNQHREVLQVYQKMSKILTMCNLDATTLVLRDNQAWELKLTNGMTLQLGKHFLEKRIKSFCRAYPAVFATVLLEPLGHLINADLRYPRGMAVQWNNKREKNG